MKMAKYQEYRNDARILHSFLKERCASMPKGKLQISQKQIAKETGLKLSRIDWAVVKLKSDGLITVEKEDCTNIPTSNIYSMGPSPRYFDLLAMFDKARQELDITPYYQTDMESK